MAARRGARPGLAPPGALPSPRPGGVPAPPPLAVPRRRSAAARPRRPPAWLDLAPPRRSGVAPAPARCPRPRQPRPPFPPTSRPRPAGHGAAACGPGVAPSPGVPAQPGPSPWRLGPARLGVPRPCAARLRPGVASARAAVVPLRSASTVSPNADRLTTVGHTVAAVG
eukprot:XP_020400974.1 uncharacterized protein LOC109942834 [Zea mays]